uniref:Uncharacterized protein n=1 Tax=Triticum urartu TaxID=4572 RepID=A0A8R7PAP8_TRIUA
MAQEDKEVCLSLLYCHDSAILAHAEQLILLFCVKNLYLIIKLDPTNILLEVCQFDFLCLVFQ